MTYILKIESDLDAAAVEMMRNELDELARMDDDLEIDMRQVRFLDSSGVGAIIFLFKRCKARGYRIELTGLVGQPLKLLHHLGIVHLLASSVAKVA